jgi:hypothetical protein
LAKRCPLFRGNVVFGILSNLLYYLNEKSGKRQLIVDQEKTVFQGRFASILIKLGVMAVGQSNLSSYKFSAIGSRCVIWVALRVSDVGTVDAQFFRQAIPVLF